VAAILSSKDGWSNYGIKKVGVLGCGLMGSGIAQVCATAGFDVTVLEVEQKYLDKGFAGIEKSLAKFAERRWRRVESLRSRRTRFGPAEGDYRTKRTWPIATS
jgi:3-hydroxyacyl-CoA dehydrogenase